MAIRPIVLYPDPALLTPTRPVVGIDDEIRRLVQDMVETMYCAPGIGLAANQLGVPLSVCIVDLSAGQEPGELRTFINPTVQATAGEQVGEEGCLSFLDITLEIKRPNEAKIESLDLEGRRTVVAVDGLMARVILHECEHLDGQVFLQNVSPLKRELIKKQIRKRIKLGDWVEAAAK